MKMFILRLVNRLIQRRMAPKLDVCACKICERPTAGRGGRTAICPVCNEAIEHLSKDGFTQYIRQNHLR